MESVAPRPRVWTITFVNLIFISLAATGVVDALQAALPIYVFDLLGHDSETTAGLLVTIFSVSGILPFLISGAFVDKIGARAVMLWGACVFLIGAASPILFQGVKSLFVWRVFQGVGFAAINVASAAAASKILPRERLGEGLGYFGLGQALAMALGPCMGLAIVGFERTVIWSIIACIIAAVTISSFFSRCDVIAPPAPRTEKTEEQKKSARRGLGVFIEKRAAIPAVAILILATAVCGTIVFVGKYGQSLGVNGAGVFFIVMAAAMAVSRFAAGKLMDTLSATTILYPTLVITAATFVMLSFAKSAAVFYLAGAPIGFGFGICVPLLAAVAVKRSPRERIGAANSTYYLCLNLGFGTGSFLGGLAIDKLGFHNAFLCGLIPCALVALVAAFGLREKKTADAAQTAPAK